MKTVSRLMAKIIFAGVVLGVVPGCGGGGSSPTETTSTPTPVALANPLAPAVTTQPVSQSVQAGQTVTFSVVATGDSPLTYQWQRNGVDVAGANAASYGFVAATADNGSTWRVKVSNAAGSVESSSVTLSVAPAPMPVNQISLVAGSLGGSGNLDGVGVQARFDGLRAIAADAAGNVYVAESGSIRKITPDSRVTHVDNSAGAYAIAVDSAGNLYATDNGRHVIRKFLVDGSSRVMAGAVDSSGYVDSTDPLKARFLYPRGLAVDAAGNLYVADAGNDVVRKISATGVVTTVARTVRPTLLAVDSSGVLFVGPEHAEDGLLKLNANGTLIDAGTGHPSGLSADRAGNVYVSTYNDNAIRRIEPNGQITRMAEWPLKEASLAFDAGGNVFSFGSEAVYKYRPGGSLVEWAGKAAGPTLVDNLIIDRSDSLYFCAQETDGSHKRYQVTAAGTSAVTAPSNTCWVSAIDGKDNLYFSNLLIDGCDWFAALAYKCVVYGAVNKLSTDGVTTRFVGAQGSYPTPSYNTADGPAAQAMIPSVDALAADSAGNVYLAAGGTVFKVSTSLQLSTFAKLPAGTLYGPLTLTVDPTGRLLYSDYYSVWQLRTGQDAVLLAGKQTESGVINGPALSARFKGISSMAVDAKGNIFVADSENHVVRKISTDGNVSTVLGKAGAKGNQIGDLPGLLDSPGGLVFDAQGNLYLRAGSAVLKVTLPK